MTVRELIHELLGHDMDAEIVAPTNNGNGIEYTPVVTVEPGRYTPYTYLGGGKAESGDFISVGETAYLRHRDGIPAVVILPNN